MDLKIAPVFNESNQFRFYDLVIKDGDLEVVTGKEEIAQRVIMRLALHYGEWFEAPEEGINQPEILGEPEDSIILRDSLKAVIAKTDGVNAVKSFEIGTLDAETRILGIKTLIDSDEGEIEIEDTIYG